MKREKSVSDARHAKDKIADRKLSVVDIAVRKIREIIVDARFEPGQKLVLSSLASYTGISVMPIREALRKLEGEGVVIFHPNKGATVKALDRKFLKDLYEVRAALHALALSGAVQHLTFTKAERLRGLCQEFDELIEKDKLPSIISCNRRLHQYIFELANNAHALRMFDRDWDVVQTLRLKFGYKKGRLYEISREQHALVEALISDDLNLAQSIMRMHNEAGLEDLLINFHGKVSSPEHCDLSV